MASHSSIALCFSLSLIALGSGLSSSGAREEERKVYIVYMGSLPKGDYVPTSHHANLLQEVTENSGAGSDYLIRSYKRSFNGFAARLNHLEQERLADMEGVVSVFPSKILQLHTTRSWDFMGFTTDIERNPVIESDIVIGVIDSGIWPESESFNDKGFGPVPRKWKGACKGGRNFACNNKIIGARYYPSGLTIASARDLLGHGTHTASIAAGNNIKDVSFYGLARGNSRGGVPSARIAAYAACSIGTGCREENVLAAFDDAIADGVDIITASIGRDAPTEIYRDVVAIGAFHAMEKGILTTNSAGNNGFTLATTSSVAPWLLSVAASSTDRRIIDKIILGNGKSIVGNSVNTFAPTGKRLLINDDDMLFLNSRAKGKILLCDVMDGGEAAFRAGAIGGIMPNDDLQINISSVVPLPTSVLSSDDFNFVKSYMKSAKFPQAEILRSEVIKDSTAPKVASFSSMGPNQMIPEILKPDITAPGVGILAAYSPAASPSGIPEDKRSVKYNILSGTSMSCPHAAGAAAYVKSMHPHWSPSAIKSALMTTSLPMEAGKNPNGEFSHGSGHLDPSKAANPGLVYEASKEDYAEMLCSIGYNAEKLRLVTGDSNSICIGTNSLQVKDLNYPSISSNVQAKRPFDLSFRRTVTNVGFANSTYKAEIQQNSVMRIKVVPNVLSFKTLYEKKSFVVKVRGVLPAESMASAGLIWCDGAHRVRSPIVVYNTSWIIPFQQRFSSVY